MISLVEKLKVNKDFVDINAETDKKINSIIDKLWDHRGSTRYFRSVHDSNIIFSTLSGAVAQYSFYYEDNKQKEAVRNRIREFDKYTEITHCQTCKLSEDMIDEFVSEGIELEQLAWDDGSGFGIESMMNDTYILILFGCNNYHLYVGKKY